MSVNVDPSEQLQAYAEVLGLLEKNLRYLEALGFGDETIHDYRKILLYLKGKTPSEVTKMLGGSTGPKKAKIDLDPKLTDDEIGRLADGSINEILADKNTSRRFLERLASIRFGVTKGALSTLRSRSALNEKIRTLVSHESTHEAISRAASGQPDGNSS